MYEKSVEALSPTTYQVANKQNFLFAKWYASLYHFVSAGLGLATVVMLAFIFSGAGAGAKYPTWLLYAMFGLTFIILCALLFGIEIFKSSLAKGIFKNLVISAKVKFLAVFGLVLVMLFSILVSAIGGAVLSYEMNDKSTEISEIYSVQSDSLRKLHDESLADANSSIQAYKANLNKGNYWAKYATREKLDKAIETRNNLLATAKSDITSVQTAKEKDINLNSSEGKNYAVISAVVVLVLELLSILAYWFQYVYHANCEREAINFEVLSSTVAVHQTEDKSKSELSEIKDLLQNLLSGNNNLQLASNTVNPSSQRVGFSFGANNTPTLKVNGESITVKVAETCIASINKVIWHTAKLLGGTPLSLGWIVVRLLIRFFPFLFIGLSACSQLPSINLAFFTAVSCVPMFERKFCITVLTNSFILI